MLSKASPIKKAVMHEWLDNVNMNTYAKFDQNIPSGSRVMNSFTIKFVNVQTDSHSDYTAHLQFASKPKVFTFLERPVKR